MLSSRTDSFTIVLLSSLYGLISGAVQPLLIFVAAAAVLLPLSLGIFAAMVRKGHIEGTLSQY
jgi:hypothetical protein